MQIMNMQAPTVGDLLGTGEFGSVFLQEMADHTKVAIKRSHYGNRYLQHERTILSLIHEYCPQGVSGIPRLYSWMDNDELAMEYIEGQVIADALMEMDEDDGADALLGYITELLEIFATLHQMQIVHKDIHEKNILLSTAGHIHVIDFGLALFQPEPSRYRSEVVDLWTLTQTWIEIYLREWSSQNHLLELYLAWYERMFLDPQRIVFGFDLLAAWQEMNAHIAPSR
jgi:tRNA A-37 threonylcarbamoyl transferase component Bud32